jgi:hypothetical protein
VSPPKTSKLSAPRAAGTALCEVCHGTAWRLPLGVKRASFWDDALAPRDIHLRRQDDPATHCDWSDQRVRLVAAFTACCFTVLFFFFAVYGAPSLSRSAVGR